MQQSVATHLLGANLIDDQHLGRVVLHRLKHDLWPAGSEQCVL
jgi:hypothetical protein